ncbi:asparaginyl-tRNA synthetase [Armillaria novae-zelandiae]|uniref:asparagine--tRNA ligase n=1 Tax=Armillaria novae-zelandiae TaxID=153914 RepID=A0AA39NYH1_9AGAR|nr:asparaginyl-tRNA synthetase [Armillaria novae-zelandiae]
MKPSPSIFRQVLYHLPPTIARLQHEAVNSDATLAVTGFIKSIRRQKRVSFAVLSDGSHAQGIQAVFLDTSLTDGLTNGTSVRLTGKIKDSPGQKQDRELLVDGIEILGECDPELYPIQKQALSNEYLRENMHLRARTDNVSAMLRLRSRLMHSVMNYFNTQGFYFTHTPILTGNDAEGAGETFRLAQFLDPQPDAPNETSEFFGHPAHLTVSSQLHLEALALGLSRVYTLSPCFRAERSQTNRHLAEFWMLEAEWMDANREGVQGICGLVEDSVKSYASDVIGSQDIEVLWKDVDEVRRKTLVDSLPKTWARMTYGDAIKALQDAKNVKFEFEPRWGRTLQSEHEKWLAEIFVGGPVFITDYPGDLKPFYMRANEDGETVGCFDLIVPYVGELVGGSVREERVDVLESKMRKDSLGLGKHEYGWYADLRRYGGSPHVGFGMGFERLVAWLGGIDNVRECVPMPRWASKMLL